MPERPIEKELKISIIEGMKNIEIINLRNEKPSNPWDIKIDRTSGLGNPYFMKNESERDLVCDRFQDYLDGNIKNGKNKHFNESLAKAINVFQEHNKLRLFCWCSPQRCHGESIRKAIVEIDMYANM